MDSNTRDAKDVIFFDHIKRGWEKDEGNQLSNFNHFK